MVGIRALVEIGGFWEDTEESSQRYPPRLVGEHIYEFFLVLGTKGLMLVMCSPGSGPSS